jgi:hypothetical protein
VPNWNAPVQRSCNLVENSAGHSSAIWSYKKPNILRISGVKVSKIQSLSKTMETQDQLSNFLRNSGLAVPGRSYVTGESLLDAYARILTIGRTFERYDKIGTYSTLEELRAVILGFVTKRPGQGLRARILGFIAKKPGPKNVTKDFMPDIRGSKIAHIGSGHTGLVPSSTRSGE